MDGSFSNKGLQVGAESGQHIAISIKNMQTNELIANAVHDKVKFGVANIGDDEEAAGVATSDVISAGNAAKYVEGDNFLTLDMLEKFYNFKTDDLADDSLTTAGAAGDKIAITSDVAMVDKEPTAADFAALNAFAKHAIKDVSEQRSNLGAIQNRLEHTISNLDNIVENTTSAEAQIRDTDIATEMVRYANNNILQQAGTSMLSQANQSNQLALSLLG